MNLEPFKVKCPECGKDVYIYSKRRSTFCSKLCETNHKYRRRFEEAKPEERPNWEEVRRLR